jgi:DNA (cytosine-5)-methyltransferase 1
MRWTSSLGRSGWDVAAAEFGIAPLGIEWDDAACATREAVGHRTLKADVAALDPLDFAPCDLLIGSPPCPTFSRAGNGAGRDDMAHVVACSRELAQGIDRREAHTEACRDARSMLVVEPLRWALALRPRAVTLEQVPDVLPYWKMVGGLLAEAATHGGRAYSRPSATACRRHASGPSSSRVATASRPYPGADASALREGQGQRSARHAVRRRLLPWVSMAEALGWGDVTVNTRGVRR